MPMPATHIMIFLMRQWETLRLARGYLNRLISLFLLADRKQPFSQFCNRSSKGDIPEGTGNK
jgi:hypothetical protein